MGAKVSVVFLLALCYKTLGLVFCSLHSHVPFINWDLGITLSQLVTYQSVPGVKRRTLRSDLGVLQGLEGHI